MSELRRWADLLAETLDDWDDGQWVHYSEHEMLSINPHPFHQDPLGIYCFPKAFQPYTSMWPNMPYKFTITLKPAIRILDFARTTEDQLDALLSATSAAEAFAAKIERYPPKDHADRLRMAWDSMREAMILALGARGRARWNKLIRDQGWDAIFDDTKTIHSAEVQLLILDPRAIARFTRQRQSSSGFAAMQTVLADLGRLCAGYGTVSIEGPKKRYDGSFHYKNSPKILQATVDVHASKDNYACLMVRHDAADKNRQGNIDISLRWSQPRLGFGTGATYNIHKQQYDGWGEHNDLQRLGDNLDRIFAASETPGQPKSGIGVPDPNAAKTDD